MFEEGGGTGESEGWMDLDSRIGIGFAVARQLASCAAAADRT